MALLLPIGGGQTWRLLGGIDYRSVDAFTISAAGTPTIGGVAHYASGFSGDTVTGGGGSPATPTGTNGSGRRLWGPSLAGLGLTAELAEHPFAIVAYWEGGLGDPATGAGGVNTYAASTTSTANSFRVYSDGAAKMIANAIYASSASAAFPEMATGLNTGGLLCFATSTVCHGFAARCRVVTGTADPGSAPSRPDGDDWDTTIATICRREDVGQMIGESGYVLIDMASVTQSGGPTNPSLGYIELFVLDP